MAHTEVPWKAEYEFESGYEDHPGVAVGFPTTIIDADGKPIVSWDDIYRDGDQMLADAEFIVTACNNYEQLRSQVAELQAELRWIPVGEQLPKTNKRVEVVCETPTMHNRFITIADYIAPRTVLSEDYLSDDCSLDFSDYDEERDIYWTPTGWYEFQYSAEINYQLDCKVLFWRKLPEMPTA